MLGDVFTKGAEGVPAPTYAGMRRRRVREVRGAPRLNDAYPEVAQVVAPVLDTDMAKNAAMMEGVARQVAQPIRRRLQELFGAKSVSFRVKKLGDIVDKIQHGEQVVDALGTRVVLDN